MSLSAGSLALGARTFNFIFVGAIARSPALIAHHVHSAVEATHAPSTDISTRCVLLLKIPLFYRCYEKRQYICQSEGLNLIGLRLSPGSFQLFHLQSHAPHPCPLSLTNTKNPPASMLSSLQSPENSPDPALRDRNRPIMTQPIPPNVMFSGGTNQTQSQSQNSPGLPSGQQQRILSSPQATPPNVDGRGDAGISPSPTNVNTHFPRPRNPSAPLLKQFQSMDENWEMREDFPDLQQTQPTVNRTTPQSVHSYPLVDAGTPPKDPPALRLTDRNSPKEVENVRRQREQQARESPQNRDRQQNSPAAPVRSSPEQRISPPYNGENNSPYSQYSPQVVRRSTLPDNRSAHSNQSPPVAQPVNRSTDRFLPVQEEAEDEPATSAKRNSWKSTQHTFTEHQRRAGSPTPSSDLNPDGNNQRYESSHSHTTFDSRSGQRTDNNGLIHLSEVDHHRTTPDDDDTFTPRSPTADLPEDAHSKYYNNPGNGNNMRTVRPRARQPVSDSLGLRGLDASVFESAAQASTQDYRSGSGESTPPAQYDQRRTAPKQGVVNSLSTQPSQPQGQPPSLPSNGTNISNGTSISSGSSASTSSNTSNGSNVSNTKSQASQPPFQPQRTQETKIHQEQKFYDPRAHESRVPSNASYYMPYPSDYALSYDDPVSFIQAYMGSPRPDAPIPPTPHSQSAAPSPSPYLTGMFDPTRDRPPFSPVAPTGSPYPYPFTHVRRNHAYSDSSRNRLSSALDPNHFQDQIARQWQMYAQNNNGHLTDSTFSPSTTPFQPGPYNPWAFLHTNRMLNGRLHDTMSMQSSPSHEPVPLPAPTAVGKKRNSLRAQAMLNNRHLPPRVDSTQPRETSPEPESSGEETAGEENFSVTDDSQWTEGRNRHSNTNSVTAVAETDTDDESNWVDEVEDDEDDFLGLEYHPSYISREDKRRRKWDSGWGALSQAVGLLL